MPDPKSIDGVLVEWGDRLFYPGNRTVRPGAETRWRRGSQRERADAIRARIDATVHCAPQVMVKVTGGGRGMKAIVAHFRYITKHGRLDIEDDQGNVSRGKASVHELGDDWRHGGSLIPEESDRREAFNIILSMPRGTDPLIVQRAAREFARAEFSDHKYVMVLHDHQANPHVHLSVRAESKHGRRLNPRKADLHRWRELFAERLRAWGVEAEATRQPTRGVARNYPALWQQKAALDGRLHKPRSRSRDGQAAADSRREAAEAWRHIASALGQSDLPADRALARSVTVLLGERERGIEPGRSR